MVAKIEDPLYRGIQHLATVVDFLLTSQLSHRISKNKKCKFLRKFKNYIIIEDELYMRDVDQVMRRVSWREEMHYILSSNHEGACGGHYAFRITLLKILLEGCVQPSIQKDVQHWCKTCPRCQRMGRKILKMEPGQVILVHDIFKRWRVDAIGPLPWTARGKIYILTDVDYLSK